MKYSDFQRIYNLGLEDIFVSDSELLAEDQRARLMAITVASMCLLGGDKGDLTKRLANVYLFEPDKFKAARVLAAASELEESEEIE